jgi:hypothetical protein
MFVFPEDILASDIGRFLSLVLFAGNGKIFLMKLNK